MSKFFKPRRTGSRARYSIIESSWLYVDTFHWATGTTGLEWGRSMRGGFYVCIPLTRHLDLTIAIRP